MILPKFNEPNLMKHAYASLTNFNLQQDWIGNWFLFSKNRHFWVLKHLRIFVISNFKILLISSMTSLKCQIWWLLMEIGTLKTWYNISKVQTYKLTIEPKIGYSQIKENLFSKKKFFSDFDQWPSIRFDIRQRL